VFTSVPQHGEQALACETTQSFVVVQDNASRTIFSF
jgi:hypothetical protein